MKTYNHFMETKKNKKEIIIECAAKVFASKGKSGTRMKDIANEASVSSALLHYHYKSKDTLYKEVLKYYISNKTEEFRETVEKSFPKKDKHELDEQIKLLIKSMDKFFTIHENFTKLLIQEMSSDGRTLKSVINDIKKDHEKEPKFDFSNDKMDRIFCGNQVCDELDPLHLRISIITLIISQYTYKSFIDMFLDEYNIDKEKFKEERLDNIAEQIWHMIRKK